MKAIIYLMEKVGVVKVPRKDHQQLILMILDLKYLQ